MTGIPKAVADTVTALRDERQTLGARLDAIDLALDNLGRVWPVNGTGAKSGGGRPVIGVPSLRR